MIDGDGAVRHEVEVPASRDEVFAFLVDPGRLVRWLGIAAELDPQPGGVFRFEVEPGEWCEGRYLEVEPPARVVVSWGWAAPWWNLPPGASRVDIRLEELPSGTRVVLVHDRLPGDLRALHDDGWTQFLARLARACAGRDAGAYPAGDPRARLAERRGEDT